MRPSFTIPLVALSGALVFLTTSALAQRRNSDIENIGIRDINKGDAHRTPSDVDAEIAMGRATSRELEQRVTLLQDSTVIEYVNRVGQNIVRNSDAKMPFAIRVVDSGDIGAIGLPGGFLYVSKGLLLAADNEAELAGVMAHEIAHVAARHAVEQQQKTLLINVAAVPTTVWGGGIPDMVLQQASQIGVPLTFLAFARAAETQADWLGLQYMYKAGYDPDARVTFFEKLQAREPAKKVSDRFATHPPTADRIKETQKNIATFLPARAQGLITSAEFRDIKARLMNRN